MKKSILAMSVLSLVLSTSAATLKSGESVAFLGDSITQFGWLHGGYVRLCEAAFQANGLDITFIPAGVSGNESDEMLNRLPGILAKKPTYMTLSCGVNDVWHQTHKDGKYTGGGVPLEDYKKNITQIIDQAQAAGVKVIVFTATMIHEIPDLGLNAPLAPYNTFLREIAKAKNCTLVDLSEEMVSHVRAARAEKKHRNLFTTDGVHMNFFGNCMMARKVLKDGFGFSSDELKKSEAAFKSAPVRQHVSVNYNIEMTGAEYMKLLEKSKKENLGATSYLKRKASDLDHESFNVLFGEIEKK